MNPLEGLPTPLLACIPILACESMGAGARLGSLPAMPGVDDCVWEAPTDEAADESAAESGLVGFLR